MAEIVQPSTTRKPDPAVPSTEDLPYQLVLELTVEDRDTIAALYEHAEGSDRDRYALDALKIGVLALRRAGTHIDAELIQRESARMLEGLQLQLGQHAEQLNGRLTGSLKEYFDPESGRFQERVERLIRQDGELEQLMRRQLGGDDSQLAKTLLTHVGEHSPLMKVLSPDAADGLLASLRVTVDGQLAQQRDQLLKQFSLDNDQGALSRLVAELRKNHGQLSDDLQNKIDTVVKEFSLDEENSALSRLVKNVDRAQRTITDQFSLDNDQSALARLKKELLTIFSAHVATNAEFQEEVKVALGKIVAKREEAQRSTRHGIEFEDAVCEFVLREAQATGDIAEATGRQVGLIRNCKIGDCVVQLGPDSPAPDARIVVEAKEDASYTLAKACQEMKLARDNRGAQKGLFVFSSKSAPAGLKPLGRYGDDIVVVWNAEDAATDIFLEAGLITTRALCIRGGRHAESQAADFEAIEKALLEIENRSQGLDEITTSANTIENASKKILDRVRINREALDRQVQVLREKIGDLKALAEPDGA